MATNTPPNQDQFDSLTSQVGNLQNIVYALQSQQSSKNTGLPRITPGSSNNAIAQVSQVRILGQSSGPTGTQITVGFNTPGGINSRLIAQYNVFLQLGNNTPAVVAAVQHSPCVFTLSSQFNNVTGIVGVQTVMQDGSTLPFGQCPTTTLTISVVSASVVGDQLTNVPVTSGTPVTLGTIFTAGSPGTYFVILSLQIGSGSSGTVNGFLYKNGVQTGNSFSVFVSTIGFSMGMFLVTLVAGDTLQAAINSTFTGTLTAVYVQKAVLKQFSS